MIDPKQMALIKKDIRGVVSNKQHFLVLTIVPLMMALVLPSIFILVVHFAPQEAGDLDMMLRLLPTGGQFTDIAHLFVGLVLNNIMPIFFMIIPVMGASVMAASSFVGEKEKRTLETLLYCPLTLRQIFRAKILASFAVSMLVTIISFVAMLAVVELELVLTMGRMMPPGAGWLAVLLLIAPAISLIAITIIVRGSAKAQTMEESQQKSTFLVLPVVLLVVAQFTGLVLISGWMLLGIGLILAAIAALCLRGSMRKADYETLLK
jgi:ABC-type Na+ efflux pump permease subunit